ncbi:54S ribosomal protein L6 mitochondrial [Diplodia seriata]|uniref:54S ribosomal protein L6 mitochondrial n=2 Tax=Diplodia seriata TaxID=420778 RepID=A0ABR3CPT6_9PEZI
MFSTARRRCLQGASATFKPSASKLTSNVRQSKIGRAPLSVPPEVQFEIIQPPKTRSGKISSRNVQGATVRVKGPLGEMSYTVPPFVEIVRETPTAQPIVKVLDQEEKQQREMWGTVRAYLQNHILGVSEGHNAILRLVGVGYRATIETTATTVESEYEGQQFVNLKVGFSHPVELGIPKGLKASTPQPTRLLLEGVDREAVMSFAAKIRAWRVPEPYKGKGIFVNDEDIKLKSKKIK